MEEYRVFNISDMVETIGEMNLKELNELFNFVRKWDFHYICAKIRRGKCQDVITLSC